MQDSVAEIVQQLFIAKNFASNPQHLHLQWPVFCGTEPEQPDNCITLYGEAGYLQGRMQPSGEEVEHYGLMIRVRCNLRESGEAKARQLCKSVNESAYRDQVILNGHTYLVHSFTPRGALNFIGKMPDSNSARFLFTANYTVTVTQQ